MRAFVLLGLFVAACGTLPGDACDEDDDCGSGFDCYRNICTRVCAAGNECGAGEQCQRYRCVGPNGEPPKPARLISKRETPDDKPAAAAAPVAKPTTPQAMPDSTSLELRAIRKQLEDVRRDQARILELLEPKPAAPKPGKTEPGQKP